MAGLALPQSSPDADRREQRRKTLHDVMELAAKFFSDTLRAKAARRRAAISPTARLDPRRS